MQDSTSGGSWYQDLGQRQTLSRLNYPELPEQMYLWELPTEQTSDVGNIILFMLRLSPNFQIPISNTLLGMKLL